MSKTFTLGEAHTLLPVLGSLLGRAQAAATRGAVLEQEMQQLSQRIFLSGGMHVDVGAAARRRAGREKAAQEAKDTVAEIEAIGAVVHDFDTGVLDLPCVVDGRTVVLCWRLGEPAITNWHEAGEDVEARQPVEVLFGRKDRERPN